MSLTDIERKLNLIIEIIRSNQIVNNNQQVFNSTEAARYLKIQKSSLYKLTSKNEIPFFKRGKLMTFIREDLDNWLFSKRYPGSNEFEIETAA